MGRLTREIIVCRPLANGAIRLEDPMSIRLLSRVNFRFDCAAPRKAQSLERRPGGLRELPQCNFRAPADFAYFKPPFFSPPEIFERRRAQLRVFGRVLDRSIAEPILNASGVMAGNGHGVAAGMAQHVGMGAALINAVGADFSATCARFLTP